MDNATGITPKRAKPKSIAEQIADLETALAQKRKKLAKQNLAKAKTERKKRDRQNYIIGAWARSSGLLDQHRAAFEAYLSRPADRAAFDLPPLAKDMQNG